jgi:hypothetical protein
MSAKSIRPLATGIVACPGIQPVLGDSPMYILRAPAFLFLAQAVLAQQPTPILPDPKLTPGDTFDVTAEDVCVFLAMQGKCERCRHGLKDRRTPSTESPSTRLAITKLII